MALCASRRCVCASLVHELVWGVGLLLLHGTNARGRTGAGTRQPCTLPVCQRNQRSRVQQAGMYL